MSFQEYLTPDGFWCFEQKGVRAFLIEGSDKALLIDSCYDGNLLGLCKEKTNKPIQLLLTHGDADHIGCAPQFGSALMHPLEMTNYLAKTKQRIDIIPINDGDIIELGRFSFELIHIPGHTAGGIGLLEKEKRFMIGGDSVQIGPIYMFGQGREPDIYRLSLEKLMLRQNEFDRVYASHNELLVPTNTIYELYSLMEEILNGFAPAAEAAPSYLPKEVRMYRKGNVAFYMNKNWLYQQRSSSESIII